MKQNNKKLLPTTYIIFGATGDLTWRKIVPGLWHLYQAGHLPPLFSVIGFSRQNLTDKEFRLLISKTLPKISSANKKLFLRLFSYHQGDFSKLASYHSLAVRLGFIDKKWRTCSSKLFHLAVPPKYYSILFQRLAASKLTTHCDDKHGWTRIMVEKPFGKDYASAQKLDKQLSILFKEKQIFRVDHYLAKETLQNILTFRFSNVLFEPVWNNRSIESIHIKALEKIDIGSRGGFYEDVGALRDFAQSHLLQMLALVTMKNPLALEANVVRRERATILKSLKPFTASTLKIAFIRGQSNIYTAKKGVAKNSKTETYFKLKTSLMHPRWKGVPIYLESGKALKEKRTEIEVIFKPIDPCFCLDKHYGHRHQNRVLFKIQPEEGITIQFWAKKAGLTSDIETRTLSFDYHSNASEHRDAYEKLIYDAMKGDQLLFTSTHEVMASWKFITSILKNWGRLPLHKYEQGSEGPKVKL